MSKRSKKCWSKAVGLYGSKVRVAERVPGGNLYLLWVGRDGMQEKRSLGHRDKRHALAQASDVAAQLANHRESLAGGRLTIGTLFHIYEGKGLVGRTSLYKKEVQRKLALWLQFLGPDREVDTLSPSDVDAFVEARKRGDIGPSRSRRLKGTTLWHDWVALNTALNFAVTERDKNGKRMLASNPLKGVKVSKTVNPNRPVAREDYYLALKLAAPKMDPMFELALDLAFATGHRIDAILNLRWDDVDLTPRDTAPHGTIHWRDENDKIENDHTLPINEVAYVALRRYSASRPGIGQAFLFPSPQDADKPFDRRLMSRWLRKAERLAGEAHVNGRGWHALRRGWASARIHLPKIAVSKGGGWKDTRTMEQAYQHADEQSVLSAVIGHKAVAS